MLLKDISDFVSKSFLRGPKPLDLEIRVGKRTQLLVPPIHWGYSMTGTQILREKDKRKEKGS